MFAEDISEDFSEDRRYHFKFTGFTRVFLDIFEIFAEDCFLLRSFRKFLPSGFLPLSCFQVVNSGTTREPKPKLFGPDIFGWGGGLPSEGVGAKKLGMSFETQETKLLGGISKYFPRISRRGPMLRTSEDSRFGIYFLLIYVHSGDAFT